MRNSRWLVGVALAVLFSGVAYADSVSLFTPPLSVEGNRFACLIVNVGDQTRAVTIIPNGAENFGKSLDLAPGQSATFIPTDPGCTDGGCGAFYCAFKVQGGKHQFRAAICAAATATSPLACLPAE